MLIDRQFPVEGAVLAPEGNRNAIPPATRVTFPTTSDADCLGSYPCGCSFTILMVPDEDSNRALMKAPPAAVWADQSSIDIPSRRSVHHLVPFAALQYREPPRNTFAPTTNRWGL